MDIKIEKISKNILELGLAALSHANSLAAYYNEANDKWEELAIIQAAHAAELLIKSKIAEVHPLLIFSDLPKVFKTITGCNFINQSLFKKFGKIRNSLQHFGIFPNKDTVSPSLETLRFIYSFIDPFINEHWNLCAIDYDENNDSYKHLPITLINYEIEFIVSEEAAKYSHLWKEALCQCSEEYQKKWKEK